MHPYRTQVQFRLIITHVTQCYAELKEVRKHSHLVIFNKWGQIRKANLKSVEIIRVAEIRDPGHSEALERGYAVQLSMIQHDS